MPLHNRDSTKKVGNTVTVVLSFWQESAAVGELGPIGFRWEVAYKPQARSENRFYDAFWWRNTVEFRFNV